jgi:hypothetical protein
MQPAPPQHWHRTTGPRPRLSLRGRPCWGSTEGGAEVQADLLTGPRTSLVGAAGAVAGWLGLG